MGRTLSNEFLPILSLGIGVAPPMISQLWSECQGASLCHLSHGLAGKYPHAPCSMQRLPSLPSFELTPACSGNNSDLLLGPTPCSQLR